MSAVIGSKNERALAPAVSGRGFIHAITMPSPSVILSSARGSCATEGKSKDPDDPIHLPCRLRGVLPRITELQEPMCRPDARWKAASRKIAV